MKKILSLLLVLVMAVGCVFAMTSCSDEPELDLNKAAAALHKNGYEVYSTSTDDAGVGNILEAFKTESGIKEFITIYECDSEATAKLYLRRFEAQYEAKLLELESKIEHAENMIDEYEDKLSAAEKSNYEKIIEECEAELEKYEDETAYGKSGTKVWYGTVAAIEATK